MDHLLYYAFDWDDNILYMPTEIIVVNDKGEEVGVSTQDFAKYRKMLSEGETFEYKGHTIVGFPKNKDGGIDYDTAYENFRDYPDPNIFEKDVKKAIQKNMFGPSWADFMECLENGAVFAIITARGHEADTLRNGVEYVIDNVMSTEQKQLMYDHLLKFAYLFKEQKEYDRVLRGKASENELVKLYLDYCEFIGVSSPSKGGSVGSPEEAKKKALLEFKEKVNKFAKSIGTKAMIGFSDDDPGTVADMEELIDEIDNEQFPHIIKYVVKNTSGGDITKKVRDVLRESKIYSFKEFEASSYPEYDLEDSIDNEMYVDVETEKEMIDSEEKGEKDENENSIKTYEFFSSQDHWWTINEMNELDIMSPEEFLDSNGIEDKVVHVRKKMDRRGEIKVKLSDVLKDYKEYLDIQRLTSRTKRMDDRKKID